MRDTVRKWNETRAEFVAELSNFLIKDIVKLVAVYGFGDIEILSKDYDSIDDFKGEYVDMEVDGYAENICILYDIEYDSSALVNDWDWLDFILTERIDIIRDLNFVIDEDDDWIDRTTYAPLIDSIPKVYKLRENIVKYMV